MKASYRIDFLGGTLDLPPFSEIYPSVVINAALNHGISVEISSLNEKNIHWIAHSQKKESIDDFWQSKKLNFIQKILKSFLEIQHIKLSDGLKIICRTDLSIGSGLAGSSALAIAFLKELSSFFKVSIDIIKYAKIIEASWLLQPATGFQDYYPAYYGGILSLKYSYENIQVEQLYLEGLSTFLQKNIALCYSGISRRSDLQNWNIYKRYFEGDKKIRKVFEQLAKISWEGLEAIHKKNYSEFIDKVFEDGFLRKKYFANFEPQEINPIRKKIKNLKFCGAGGGGYFLAPIEISNTMYREKVINFSFLKPLI